MGSVGNSAHVPHVWAPKELVPCPASLTAREPPPLFPPPAANAAGQAAAEATHFRRHGCAPSCSRPWIRAQGVL